MNKDRVMSIVKKKSKEMGATVNIILMLFFFEQFLRGLSESEYKSDMILKGGFLLSTLIGIETRTTTDLDFSLRNRSLDEESLKAILDSIAERATTGDLAFEITRIEAIKINDIYPGFKAHILGKLQNIRQPFSIDIATGDPITPDAISYKYKSVFESSRDIDILTYNIETSLSEKLETVVSRKTDNSRSKDFYDLYMVLVMRVVDYDTSLLREAIANTFEYRGTPLSYGEVKQNLEDIRHNDGFRRRWDTYCKRNAYVQPVEFDEMIVALEKSIDEIREF